MIRKLVLALLCSIGVAQVYGQTISGTILNERSEAIPYVKITVKSNNKPFLADGKGLFQVSVTDLNNEILIFTAMGYQKQEVPVAGKTNLTVVLLEVSQDTKDVVVVGARSSELENYLEQVAQAQARYVKSEPTPERGYYYRSDHFNFAKVGVPALYAESGEDHIEFGVEYGAAQAQDYMDNRYHAVSDEYDPAWDLSGAVEDIYLYFDIANTLSQEADFPDWFVGNEFKALRDSTASQR